MGYGSGFMTIRTICYLQNYLTVGGAIWALHMPLPSQEFLTSL